MKILFFSDLHIHHTHRFSYITPEGYTVRELEHLQCADTIIDLIDSENIDKVVFGGDAIGPVGDNLSTQCLHVLCTFIEKIQKKCIEKNITFDILVGNHDISGHLNNQYSHKLIPFKNWQNITIYDQPTQIDNFVYMPFCISDEYAQNYLENIKNKSDKIVFSHLEIKGIPLGNNIETTKGVNIALLNEFKVILQGHYHSGDTIGSKIKISGSTQRLSFKDQGKSRNNIIIYDTDSNKIIRKSFDCPDWLFFNDDNIDDILKTSSNNYVKVEVTMDLLLTDAIKEKINTFKGKDVSVDITRISINKKVDSEIKVEDEIGVLTQFIEKSDNTDEQKEALKQEGIKLIEKVKS